jgi:hypothetical protein
MIPHDTHLQIGSLLFEGLDQIDLTGPFEVLSRLPNSTYRIFAKTTEPVRDTRGLLLRLMPPWRTRPNSMFCMYRAVSGRKLSWMTRMC